MKGQLRFGTVLVSLLFTLGACTPTPTPTVSASPPGTTGAPSASATTGAPTPTASAATMTVTLYFGSSILNPGSLDCAKVYAVHRAVPESADRLTATMKQLLAGPSATEAAQGYTSWFSPATAGALVRAKVSGGKAYVNLTDIRTIIPNASTSCGSEALLAQLGTTAGQAAMAPQVRYAISGQPKPFWEWLQMGCDASNDNCDPAPFQN